MEEPESSQNRPATETQPRVPEEDQPLSDRPKRRRRIWLELLTPISILIAGASISGALWLNKDGAPSPTGVGADSSTSLPPSASSVGPQSLLEAYESYAEDAGLDSAEFRQCLFDELSTEIVSAHLRRGAALGVSGTPTFFINNKKLVGAQPAAVFEEIIEGELSDSPPQTTDAYSDSVQALAATRPPRFEIVESIPDVSDAPIEGDESATVMIAEFSDFECPFCQRWSEETLRTLRPQLGSDVALAFLHFPIVQIHPNAANASVAAYCADLQGKFWEMHDLLFLNQGEWAPLRAN